MGMNNYARGRCLPLVYGPYTTNPLTRAPAASGHQPGSESWTFFLKAQAAWKEGDQVMAWFFYKWAETKRLGLTDWDDCKGRSA